MGWKDAPAIESDQRPAPMPPPRVNPSSSLDQRVLNALVGAPVGLGETALSIGSGLLAMPAAGLAGLATLATGGDAKQAVETTQHEGTYEPRSQVGQETLNLVSWPFRQYGKLTEAIGDKNLERYGPVAAGLDKTTLDLLPFVLGKSKGAQTVSDAMIDAADRGVMNAKAGATKAKTGMQNITDMLTQGGAERILTRYQRKITGEASVPKVVTKLRQAQELVPGSQPTAGQALAKLPEGSPLIEHQRIAAETPSGPSGEFGQRVLDQQAARKALLAPLSKSDPSYTPVPYASALDAAEAIKKINAEKNYAAAYDVILDPSVKLPKRLAENPFIKKAIGTSGKKLTGAYELAKAEGINPQTNLTRFLHFVKVGLDEQLLPTPGTALEATRKAAIMDAKKALVSWMEQKNPLYKQARQGFASDSIPINEMQVGQALESKLTTPMGTESPGTFLRAADDASKLIKDATGMPRQVLNHGQQKIVDALTADLERDLASKRPVQPTNLHGGVNVGEDVRPHLPQMLTRPMMATNAVMRHLGKNIEPQIDAAATRRYLTPSLLADALESVPPSSRYQVVNALLRQSAPYALAGATANTLARREP